MVVWKSIVFFFVVVVVKKLKISCSLDDTILIKLH